MAGAPTPVADETSTFSAPEFAAAAFARALLRAMETLPPVAGAVADGSPIPAARSGLARLTEGPADDVGASFFAGSPVDPDAAAACCRAISICCSRTSIF